jgi:hypothetical protein
VYQAGFRTWLNIARRSSSNVLASINHPSGASMALETLKSFSTHWGRSKDILEALEMDDVAVLVGDKHRPISQ